MTTWRLPTLLAVALIVFGSISVARDVGHRPSYRTTQGLPVEIVQRDAPPVDELPMCWPSEQALASELDELVPLGREQGAGQGALSPCGRPLPEAIVLERWDDGRYVWWPGRRLVLERW